MQRGEAGARLGHEVAADGGQASPGLAAAEPCALPLSLDVLRDRIDALDRELVTLLAQRAQVSLAFATTKEALGCGVRDPAREAVVLAERRAWAERLGLDPAFTGALFEAILAWSRDLQAAARRHPHPASTPPGPRHEPPP
jgi:prephenate dehydrogenase